MAQVRAYQGQFYIKVDAWDSSRAKGAPKRAWIKEDKIWCLPPTRPNALYILREFSEDEISKPARKFATELADASNILVPFPEEYEFKSDPMPHQMEALHRAWGRSEYAFFFEMRLGKTFTSLNLAFARYHLGHIQRLLVVCPTPIKDVWVHEIEKFATVPVDTQVLAAGNHLQGWKQDHLHILIVGVEALSQGGAYAKCMNFTSDGTMMIIDESSRIKNFKSKRTEKCVILGGRCDYRAILTGTPITQGLHDLYSQFEFLNQNIIGQKSFYTFRNRYMVMGGFEGRQVMGYRNAKELMDLTAPYSSVVKTDEVYEVPYSEPQQRVIQPTPEQKQYFSELKNYMRTISEDGEELEIGTILERMTRFQQINGGNFPYVSGTREVEFKLDGKKVKKIERIWDTKPMKTNPKLNELEQMLDELGDQQVIIWARFVPEIQAITDMLERNNKTWAQFYGDVPEDQRSAHIGAFQNNEIQFFVGNQNVGGMGVKLSNADIMIYYSNTYSYEDRKQSEARWQDMQRTEDACMVIDLVLNTTIDKAIMAAQEKKGGMAAYVDKNLKTITRELK